ncbi:MAG: CPBP family intramembrane metalloprotease [Kiritimatiellae bacterium]|nr:CPBP family intramembrane metalloprotease [Kiritimatiellia bacterium]
MIAHAAALRDGAEEIGALGRLLERPLSALALHVVFVASLVASVLVVATLAVRRPRAKELLARPWTDCDLLRLVSIVLALASLAGIATCWAEHRWSNRWTTEEWRALNLSMQSVTFHWPILAFAAARMRRLGVRSSDAFGMCRRSLPRDVLLAGVLYLAALPIVSATTWGAKTVMRWLGVEPALQPVLEATIDDGSGTLRAYLVFLAVVIAPVAEEILFRGIGLPVLARRLGPVAALGATSLIFAAIHCNLAAAAPLFVLSLAFGLAYLYTGSLTVPIAMHSAVNAVSLALASWLAR